MNAEHQDHPWATFGTGNGGDYRWFDHEQPTGRAWGRHLPHWRQPGCVYFITFRLHDSIPEEVLTRWQTEREQWLQHHPYPHDEPTAREYHRLFTARTERYLDTCHGSCPFRQPAVRQIMAEILHACDGKPTGYGLDAYIIMPNHIHTLVAPTAAYPLSKLVRDWKSISAHRINKHLQRQGPLWQHESWDHIVRSPQHMDKYRRYIADNPKYLPKQ